MTTGPTRPPAPGAGAPATARMDAALAAIAAHEPDVRAFAWLDPAGARRRAEAADAEAATGATVGPLFGVPLGVKDIFDTAGIPTESGSPVLRGRVPAGTAAVVGALESAGAILVGKTVTTEFAFFDPGPTRNPWDLARTPGGSSMGSAAGVAAGFVDLAVGSQTQGSVIRPAAFCGVVGLKPSHGVLSADGALPVAPTLDTVGLFTRTVAEAAAAFAVLTGGAPPAVPARPPRLAVARAADLAAADDAARDRLAADVAAAVAAGAEIVERPFTAVLEDVRDLVLAIQDYEAARTVGAVIAGNEALTTERIRAVVARGRAMDRATYEDALAARERLRAAWQAWSEDLDAVLTIPARGEAPPAAEGTGDPRWCSRWTLLGAPAITLPTGLGPHGLPLGLQVIGAPGTDDRVLGVARWLEAHLPGIGAPSFRGAR